MPLTQSATKRARQSIVRHGRLLPYKTLMKTMMRKVSDAEKAGDKAALVSLMPHAYKMIDMAAKKNIIARRNADRKKSRIARIIAGMK